jgi:hypothetical protein
VVTGGQVFVSHTSDMAQTPPGRSFAQAAMDAIIRAGMTPVDMQFFAAWDGSPADYCRRRVRECEIYVAVIGFRYGSLAPDETISFTELEFQEAGAVGLPRLIFLLEDTAGPAGPPDADRERAEAFRQRLRDAGLLLRAFTSGDNLELEVFHGLSRLARDRPPAAQPQPQIWNVPKQNADFCRRSRNSPAGALM